MNSNLAMILMTATFVLGIVYGSLGKSFPSLHQQSMSVGDTTMQQKTSTQPIDATFVALFSTYLPRNTRLTFHGEKRVPEYIHWVEAEIDE